MEYEQFVPLIALLILFIIAFFLALGVYFSFRTRKKIKYWNRAKGVVIELVAKGWGGGHRLYSPKVRFTAKDGSEPEFIEYWQSHPPRFRVGEEVTVLYDPKDLSKACVFMKSSIMYYPGWLFLLLGGVFLLLFGLVAVVFGVAFYYLGAPGQR